ncbi:MAG: hypothetical protein RR415_12850 [Ruthenibacterium sp.]
MRIHKSEKDLMASAKKIAEAITINIETKIGGSTHSDTETRPTTTAENELIFKIAYATLLGLNWGEQTRNCPQSAQAIIDTAEFAINLFIPECNGYNTMYLPLRTLVDAWEDIPS